MSRYRPARDRRRKAPPVPPLERTANYQARPLARSRTPIQWPPRPQVRPGSAA